MDLERKKYQLQGRANARDQADGVPQSDRQKIGAIAAAVPVRKIYDQLQYLENELLPKVKENKGVDSTEYKIFTDLFRSLMYAVVILDRHDWLEKKYLNAKMMGELFRERAEMQEKELQRFLTMEDLLLSDSVDKYADAIKKNISDFFTKK